MSKTILVVDDESKMLEMIGNYLQKEGFGVMTAAAGREALRKAKEEQPDLIVLDWMMPDIAGIEVLAELRKFSQAPVIMLTAKTEEVDKLLGLEMGADDYITKPFSLRELSARIRAQLRRAGVLSAAASDT
ncbi:MAG: response regulator, partial [Negativicutes bacterium]|nr:response regulator [Negativicutes bacterium]